MFPSTTSTRSLYNNNDGNSKSDSKSNESNSTYYSKPNGAMCLLKMAYSEQALEERALFSEGYFKASSLKPTKATEKLSVIIFNGDVFRFVSSSIEEDSDDINKCVKELYMLMNVSICIKPTLYCVPTSVANFLKTQLFDMEHFEKIQNLLFKFCNVVNEFNTVSPVELFKLTVMSQCSSLSQPTNDTNAFLQLKPDEADFKEKVKAYNGGYSSEKNDEITMSWLKETSQHQRNDMLTDLCKNKCKVEDSDPPYHGIVKSKPSTIEESMLTLSDSEHLLHTEACVVCVLWCDITMTALVDTCTNKTFETMENVKPLMKRVIDNIAKQSSIGQCETKSTYTNAQTDCVCDEYTAFVKSIPSEYGFRLERIFLFDKELEAEIVPLLSLIDMKTFENRELFNLFLSPIVSKIKIATEKLAERKLLTKIINDNFVVTKRKTHVVPMHLINTCINNFHDMNRRVCAKLIKMTNWEINNILHSMGVVKQQYTENTWVYCGLQPISEFDKDKQEKEEKEKEKEKEKETEKEKEKEKEKEEKEDKEKEE